jgi:hypothetical protein
MGHLHQALAVAFCAAALSACAAKQYVAMPMEQPGDEQLTCVQLQEMIAANEKAAGDFIKKDKSVENKNVARNVAGVVPFVGILALLSTDLSNEEQVKARSILDRNERLVFLSKQKGCSP